MKILTKWLRNYLPGLPVDDAQLAEDLTLRGIAVDGIYPLGEGNGSFYEMDVTTNRVDAMNHYGVAREAAAIYGLTLPELSCELPKARPGGKPFSVRIEAEDACGRFTARVLRDVTMGASRDWFAGAEVSTYFGLLEQKQISNAVDATNFAWIAMGQPTHVFDLDKLEGGIVVRRAKKGEKLKTLDGVERVLDAEDLVVADHKKAVGLAGVMGGWETMITAETKNVLVESAWFDPMAVRKTARRHGLHTDASHRLRARGGLQCRAGGFGSGEQNFIGEWRLAGGRTGGCARAGDGGADGQAQAGGAGAERGVEDSGRDGGRRGNYRRDSGGSADRAGV
jgi:phenylalanyl-tRNA synthetase beta chain